MSAVCGEGPGENFPGVFGKSSLTDHLPAPQGPAGTQLVVLNTLAYPGGQFWVLHLKEAF